MNESNEILISRVFAYPTLSDDAETSKTLVSVGIAVANRLNGDELLVGSFDDSDDEEPRKIGFITARAKFGSKLAYLEADEEGKKALIDSAMVQALDHIKDNLKQFRVASALNPKKWSWGSEDEEYAPDGNAVACKVKFGTKVLKADPELVEAKKTEVVKGAPAK